MTSTVANHGFEMASGVLDGRAISDLLDALGPTSSAGRRGLLGQPAIATLARSPQLMSIVHPHLSAEPLPVRAIYFDKTPETNWLVPWHQDLTIAVQEQKTADGFGPWSVKDGIPHVQPPVQLLEQMLTIRLHLDDASAANGALRVLPDSHNFGRLSAARIQELRDAKTEVLCGAKAGDALLMRPLILHASSQSTGTGHRRILHIEYAAFALPNALAWHESA